MRFEFARSRRERRPPSPPPPSEKPGEGSSQIGEEVDLEGGDDLSALVQALHHPRNILHEKDWTDGYLGCPFWGGDWLVGLGDNVQEWPAGIEIFGGRMYFESRLCIPTSYAAHVVRQHHADCGHPGPKRLWRDLHRRYAWADEGLAKNFRSQ